MDILTLGIWVTTGMLIVPLLIAPLKVYSKYKKEYSEMMYSHREYGLPKESRWAILTKAIEEFLTGG